MKIYPVKSKKKKEVEVEKIILGKTKKVAGEKIKKEVEMKEVIKKDEKDQRKKVVDKVKNMDKESIEKDKEIIGKKRVLSVVKKVI